VSVQHGATRTSRQDSACVSLTCRVEFGKRISTKTPVVKRRAFGRNCYNRNTIYFHPLHCPSPSLISAFSLSLLFSRKWFISRGTRIGTPFPMSKCLRTHYGRRCEPFSGQNALDCMILYIQSQHCSAGGTPGSPQPEGGGRTHSRRPSLPRCLDPDTNFRLARQRSHYSCFTKRPLSQGIVASQNTAGRSKDIVRGG